MGTVDCSVSDKWFSAVLYFITELTLLYYLAPLFLWLQSQDSLGVTYVSSPWRPNIMSSLTHLYISSYAQRKLNISVDTIMETSLVLSYYLFLNGSCLKILYIQQIYLWWPQILDEVTDCTRMGTLASARVDIPTSVIHFMLHSFLKEHIKHCRDSKQGNSWRLVSVRQIQTAVENEINYPEVCLSGLAGDINMLRIRTQHMLGNLEFFFLEGCLCWYLKGSIHLCAGPTLIYTLDVAQKL